MFFGENKKDTTKRRHQKPRHQFSAQEDAMLVKQVGIYGDKNWDQIAEVVPGLTGRQCRDRFRNYLMPNLNNGPWTRQEDILLIEKFHEIGPHWSKIASYFPDRSSNNIKNRWYTVGSRLQHNTFYQVSQVELKHMLNDEDNNMIQPKIGLAKSVVHNHDEIKVLLENVRNYLEKPKLVKIKA